MEKIKSDEIIISIVLDHELTRLLREQGLPTGDLESDEVEYYGIYLQDFLIAAGAIQKRGFHRMIRSLAVSGKYQSKGLGRKMVKYLEYKIAEEGIQSAYLLTEIPEYFMRLGYHQMERDNAPAGIATSRQFTELCSSSAILMKIEL